MKVLRRLSIAVPLLIQLAGILGGASAERKLRSAGCGTARSDMRADELLGMGAHARAAIVEKTQAHETRQKHGRLERSDLRREPLSQLFASARFLIDFCELQPRSLHLSRVLVELCFERADVLAFEGHY